MVDGPRFRRLRTYVSRMASSARQCTQTRAPPEKAPVFPVEYPTIPAGLPVVHSVSNAHWRGKSAKTLDGIQLPPAAQPRNRRGRPEKVAGFGNRRQSDQNSPAGAGKRGTAKTPNALHPATHPPHSFTPRQLYVCLLSRRLAQSPLGN